MIAKVVALLALRERAKVAVHNAQEAAVEAAVRIAIKAVAGVFLLIALIYGTLALYLWLATFMQAWAALGIVAAGLLVIGVVVLLLGGGSGKSRDAGGRASAPPPPRGAMAGGATAGAGAGLAAGGAHDPHGFGGDPVGQLIAKGQDAGLAAYDHLRRHPETAIAAAVATGFIIGRSAGLRKVLLAGISAALGAQASNRRERW
ncbi:phage holin family protein [Caenispirillum bisanense]|uniref:phage holin family protein n=1 Tax=Caenispirillum bisanense TaxID=414052 RepID=UPI0031D6EEFF